MSPSTVISPPSFDLRDPRHAYTRGINRAMAARAEAAPTDDAARPERLPFGERARRVEVPGLDAGRPRAARDDAPSFAEQMKRVVVARPSEALEDATNDPRGAARTAAEQMVATLFVQPMLDMALKSETEGPFAPGRAEKTFGPLLHQRLADEIVQKSDLGLVDAIVDQLVEDAEKGVARG